MTTTMDMTMNHQMQDGDHGGTHQHMGHGGITSLIHNMGATHIAVNNGSWFNASTWKNGKVPGNGAKALISEGVTVTYDQESDARINTVAIKGRLKFTENKNTKLVVETMLNGPTGTLDIGTSDENFVAADKTAKIVFTSDRAIGALKAWDPTQLGKGLVSHGKVNIFGADKADSVTLAGDVIAGDNVLNLSQVPTGWRVGDTIVLGGSSLNRYGNHADNSVFQDEVLKITAINGTKISFENENITTGDKTVLRYDHQRPDIAEKESLKLYVANTTRNVSFETEGGKSVPIKNRAHVMFMHNPDVQVHNAGFYELGRSDKSQLVDDVGTNVDGSTGNGTNPRGRYALHFHRNGATDLSSTAAVAEGNAVVGSPGWGITHHDSHVNLIKNVVFDVIGAGIAAESGNEIGIWKDNIVIKATSAPDMKIGLHHPLRRERFDFGIEGVGYWIQGAAQVQNQNNVAISSNTGLNLFGDSLQGTFFKDVATIPVKSLPIQLQKLFPANQVEVEVNDIPLREFTGFESYNTVTGMVIWAHMTDPDGRGEFLGASGPGQKGAHDGRSLIEDFQLWGVEKHGIQVVYSSNIDFKDGLVVSQDPIKQKGLVGISQNEVVVDTQYDNVKVEGFTDGIRILLPGSGSKDVQVAERLSSTIKNSDFTNNKYALGKVDHLRDGSPISLQSFVQLENNKFDSNDSNKAPVAQFQTKSIGGQVLELNASQSYDVDPTIKENNAKGIVAYAWDLDSDGRIDQFGSKIEHFFDDVGPQGVTLTVWDHAGATNQISQTVNVEQRPYTNAFLNGNFDQTQSLKVSENSSKYANRGWYTDAKIVNGNALLSAPGKYRAALGQVVADNKVRRGEQNLSFRLKNIEGGTSSLKAGINNEVSIGLWGVNGDFYQNPREKDGIRQIGTLPMQSELLLQKDFGGVSGEFFDWKNFSYDVDLGDGYDHLLFKVISNKAKDKGDVVAIDDVSLTGSGKPSGKTDSQTPPKEKLMSIGPLPNNDPKIEIAAQPVVNLSFDEGTGAVAADTSTQGTDNSGTLEGASSWVKRPDGYAVAFKDGGDVVSLSNSKDINKGIHKKRTISLQFKVDELLGTTGKQVIYEEGGGVRGLNIYIDQNQLFVGGWNIPNQESSWKGTWLSTDGFSKGEWQHVSLVLDAGKQVAQNTLSAYLNGQLFGTGEGSQLWGHPGGIGLGSINRQTRFKDGQVAKSGHGLIGAIDEVKIFNDALTSIDIQTLAAPFL
ncbi:MAG: G8 domain-containing protein [Cyanobacteria bacterium J06634_6]